MMNNKINFAINIEKESFELIAGLLASVSNQPDALKQIVKIVEGAMSLKSIDPKLEVIVSGQFIDNFIEENQA